MMKSLEKSLDFRGAWLTALLTRAALLTVTMILGLLLAAGAALADTVFSTSDSPTTKEDCKNGGYAKYGFKNHGQCIKAVKLPPDTTPPEITISGPGTDPPPEGEIANWVDSTSATVSFSANEPGVSFECWLHPGLAGNGLPTSTWTPCSSPLNFSNLPEGQKYVSVRGTDPSGNTTPGPNSQEIIWVWQVDTKAPYAQIDGAQPEVVNTNSLRVSFSAHDEIITGGTGRQTAEVRLDGGAWGAPTFSDNGGLTMRGYHDLTGLSDGRHIFEFRSTDAAGHVSNIASYSFTVDTAPSTTILSNTTKGDK